MSLATQTQPAQSADEEGAMRLDDTPYFELINEAELAKLLAHYGKTQALPRVAGQQSDHMMWVKGKDKDGNTVDVEVPMKVGKLLVAPKWLIKINKDLTAIIQNNCHAAACNI